MISDQSIDGIAVHCYPRALAAAAWPIYAPGGLELPAAGVRRVGRVARCPRDYDLGRVARSLGLWSVSIARLGESGPA
jgi:hypothetical protein